MHTETSEMSTKQKTSHCFAYSVDKGPTVKRKKNHNKDWTETSELVSSKEEILLKTYKLSVFQCKTKISKSSSSDENVSRSCACKDRGVFSLRKSRGHRGQVFRQNYNGSRLW